MVFPLFPDAIGPDQNMTNSPIDRNALHAPGRPTPLAALAANPQRFAIPKIRPIRLNVTFWY
jgi:hypothetical protein